MAIIYDFSAYHTPRLLRSFSQQTGDVVRQLSDLGENLTKIDAHLYNIQEIHCQFSLRLSTFLFTLKKARKFARRCSAACELDSLEQMIEKRNQIIRDRQRDRQKERVARSGSRRG